MVSYIQWHSYLEVDNKSLHCCHIEPKNILNGCLLPRLRCLLCIAQICLYTAGEPVDCVPATTHITAHIPASLVTKVTMWRDAHTGHCHVWTQRPPCQCQWRLHHGWNVGTVASVFRLQTSTAAATRVNITSIKSWSCCANICEACRYWRCCSNFHNIWYSNRRKDPSRLDGWFLGSLATKLCPNNVLSTRRMASQNILKNIAKLCLTPLVGKHIWNMSILSHRQDTCRVTDTELGSDKKRWAG